MILKGWLKEAEKKIYSLDAELIACFVLKFNDRVDLVLHGEEDFDLKNGLLYIRRTVQRVSFNDSGGQKTVVMIGPPKSFKSEREIPIPEHLLEYLKQWKKEQRASPISAEKGRGFRT